MSWDRCCCLLSRCHNRYAHITSLMGESVNTKLLGMTKVVSDDSARRALWKIDRGRRPPSWLQEANWLIVTVPCSVGSSILDADVTVKTLYGKQEGAVVGYK